VARELQSDCCMKLFSFPGANGLLHVCAAFALTAFGVACTQETIVHKTSSSSGQESDTTTSTDDTDSTPLDAGAGNGRGTNDAAPPPPSSSSSGASGANQKLPYWGGGIIENMQLVTITFTGDALRSVAEQFDDTITSTPWWDTVTAGYCDQNNHCIGHGSGAGHVHLAPTNLAKSYTDDGTTGPGTIGELFATNIQNGKLPPPNTSLVYVVFFPATTTINGGSIGTSCTDFEGYHSSVTMTPPGATSPLSFPYVIIPRCATDQDSLTYDVSHELIETATDPFSASTGAGFGSTSDAWDLVSGGEVGDRCVGHYDGSGNGALLAPVHEGSYAVTRGWNNAAAIAGHDPCVPSPSGTPYFNVFASVPDRIGLTVGGSTTLTLAAHSDVAMSQPFHVSVNELTSVMGAHDVLGLSLDRSSVQNGDTLSVTVSLKNAPDVLPNEFANGDKLAVFQVVSTYGSATNTSVFSVYVK
jgi:hypothetical protein